jgi:hypothetical protein
MHQVTQQANIQTAIQYDLDEISQVKAQLLQLPICLGILIEYSTDFLDR